MPCDGSPLVAGFQPMSRHETLSITPVNRSNILPGAPLVKAACVSAAAMLAQASQ